MLCQENEVRSFARSFVRKPSKSDLCEKDERKTRPRKMQRKVEKDKNDKIRCDQTCYIGARQKVEKLFGLGP